MPPLAKPNDPVAAVDRINKRLQLYKNRQYNILSPTTYLETIAPPLEVSLPVVKIDPDLAKNEVYIWPGTENKGLILTKRSLLRLADAAGLELNRDETRRLDDGKNPHYVEYQAELSAWRPDGTTAVAKRTKTIDIPVDRLRLFDHYSRIAQEHGHTDEWVLRQLESELLLIRQNKVTFAETKALLLAIRQLLGVQYWYTPEELAKPFVILRVVPKARVTPRDRHLAVAALYGG